MAEIVIIGGGGHAKVLASVLNKAGYAVLGYTDTQDRGALVGAPHLGDDTVLGGLVKVHRDCHAVIGVGKTDTSAARIRLQKHVRALGFRIPVVVSPAAVVNEEVSLGPGTVVFDGVVVNSGTVTGDCCILNTHCTVEHDCHLGDNVHVSPAVTLSGGVTIGAGCMIGAGSIVVHNVTICGDCLIGAGSTVVRDISVAGIYVGTPARRIR